MRWLFGRKKAEAENNAKVHNTMRDLMLAESQRGLLQAATETADMAQLVTRQLKSKLSDTIEQLENTVRILNDALIICDTDGKVQAFNPAAEKMFKMTANEVRESFVGDLFSSSTHNFINFEDVWSFLAMMDIEEDEHHDLRGVRKDGSDFTIEVSHTKLDRSDGSSIVLLILRDASICDDCSDMLKCYKSIFEESFDSIFVVKGQTVLAANKSAGNLFGYSAEHLLSKTVDMLILPSGRGIHQDGHLFDISITTTQIIWQNEEASLITIKTIAQIKAVKDSPKMICCFDENFKITFVNSEFATFYNAKRSEIIGKDIRDVLPKEECDPFLLNINSLNSDHPTRKMQLHTRDGDGGMKMQIWVDHVSSDGTEFQRIGQVG